MPITIIFNGTSDTYYKTDQDYLTNNQLEGIGTGCHTLSFFADCVAMSTSQQAEPLLQAKAIKPDPYLLTISNELIIIQGADNAGTEVHNLIVAGLMAAVNALLRGESSINFVGFSRGSVEAVHMTHELQRIKQYLNDPTKDHSPAAIASFICEGCFNPSNLPYGRWRTSRLNDYYKAALIDTLASSAYQQNLIQGLKNLRCNGMLLDPVPGMCEGSTFTYIPWKSPHHTEIAPLVDELNVTYMSDELSAGFRAVWIDAAEGANTKINRFHLPGFHSTANGNPVNHDPVATLQTGQFPFESTRSVQKLYFYKLLQFAQRHHIQLKSPELLAGRYLTPVFEHFMTHAHHLSAQNSYLRALYKDISDNTQAYHKARHTYYIPRILGLAGGTEQHADNQRIIMTKSGAQSLAECFNFDISRATPYINFDSFFLDFIDTFFPELTQPSEEESVPQHMTYSGIGQIVTAKYASTSTDIDCYGLTTKISALLEACQSHETDSPLNKILLQNNLDQNGILKKLLELVPQKLADWLYRSPLSSEDRTQIQSIITYILNFTLPELSEDDLSLPPKLLLDNKRLYVESFKANMRQALIEHSQKTLAHRLNSARQFLYKSFSNSADAFGVIDFAQKAEQYYQLLIKCKSVMAYAGQYFTPEFQQTMQYTLDEVVAQFPASCERVIQRHFEGGYPPELLQFQMMQPIQARLEQEKTLQSAQQQVRTLLYECEIQKQKISNLVTAKNALSMQLHKYATAQQLAIENRSSQQNQLDAIQQHLLIAQQPQFYSGFQLQLISSLILSVGMLIIALSAVYLALGTTSVIIPCIGGLSIGAAMASIGIFGFSEGSRRKRDQALIQGFFPTPNSPGLSS